MVGARQFGLLFAVPRLLVLVLLGSIGISVAFAFFVSYIVGVVAASLDLLIRAIVIVLHIL